MGSWMDPEQGQKVAEGVPASYYGTFQGQASYPPQPQTQYAQPPSYSSPSDGRIAYPVISDNQAGHQDYGRPAWGAQQYQQSARLPFCNLGYGWFLFILGFLLVVPWYVGAILLFCLAHDERERGGLVACTIAAVFVLLFGGTRHVYHQW